MQKDRSCSQATKNTIGKKRAKEEATCVWRTVPQTGTGTKGYIPPPPIDRNIAPLYISHPKEMTELGFDTLGWAKAQLEKMHQARLKG